MKKILTGSILLFAIVVLITPLFVGMAAEKEINKQINNLSQATDVTISNVYNRHWFTSNTETTFNLSKLLASYNVPSFDGISSSAMIMVKTKSEILHGPLALKRFHPKQSMTVPVLGVTKNIIDN